MGLTVAAEPTARAIDGRSPTRTLRAAHVEDVVDTIRSANEAREAIVLWGGGTRIGEGDAPERYDVALDLGALTGVVAYEPDDLVITVRAGTTLAELAGVLAPHRQRWPVEPGLPERATVGGTIAAAAGGPSRLRFFHPRDWTLGCEAVLGDGTRTRAGGRVVKNVTGYDLTRLYSGSYGTLCALTELTLKLTAAPERVVTLRADLLSIEHAHSECARLLARCLPLDALAVVTGPIAERVGAPTWTGLFARVAGSASVVARLCAELERDLPLQETGGAVWERIAALPLEAETSIRVTYAAGALLPNAGAEGGVLYPGVAVMHSLGEETAERITAVRAAAEAKGGAVVIERAAPALRSAVGTWGTPRLPATVARGLKSRFDPRGVLAPGRMPLG